LRFLAFDTAGDGCSACLFEGEAVTVFRLDPASDGRSERLPDLLVGLLEDRLVGLDDLDALAVCVGPGSFSGIRTGVAAARGLALATGLPVFGVTSFAALVARLLRESRDGRPIAAAIDARRGQIYCQRFDPAGAPAGPPVAAAPEAVAATLEGAWRVVGSGASLLHAHLRDAALGEMIDRPLDAVSVGTAVLAAAARGVRPVAGTALRPLYLRDADARPDAGRSLLPVEG
jgi:tRNA threonylcarbamoyladenosine biosynthesis protein TsaB